MPISLHDLLTEPPEREVYLSAPLLPRAGMVVIGAPSKHMKSFLALNMAYDLAEGTPLFGLQRADGSYVWPVVRPLTVLYIEQEIGRGRLRARMAPIQAARQGQLAGYNIHFESKDRGFRLDTEAGVARITELVQVLRADVLVLDPLRRFHLQGEDDSESIESLLQPVYALQEKEGVALILVHHTGKRSEFRDQRDPEALRGSSHLYAAGDTYMMITRPVANRKSLLQVDFSLRSSEDPPPLRLEFDPNTNLLLPVAGART